jgi:hypothetical protein
MTRRIVRVFASLLIAGGVALAAGPLTAGRQGFFDGFIADFMAKLVGFLLVASGVVTLYVMKRGQAVTFDLRSTADSDKDVV